MPLLKTLHVLGATFLVGGVSAQLLLRPMAGHAAESARLALYNLAWRIQVWLVFTGSALLLVTGVLLWFGHFSFFTGWLLLGILLYVAASALDGAFLSPSLRRARVGAKTGATAEPITSGPADSLVAQAGTTIQLITWVLLVVVVFLMTARPFK